MEKDYKIIDYSANAMDNEQKSAFEMELENDQFSQKEIEDYRLIFKGLEAIGDQELREKLSSIENKLDGEGFFIEDDEILDYLDKKSENEIAQKIESRRQLDADFDKRVLNLKAVKEGINLVGDDELRQRLKIITNQQENQKKRFFINNNLLKIAAAFVGILTISLVAMNWLKPKENTVVVENQSIQKENNPTKVEQPTETETKNNIQPITKEHTEKKPDYLALAKANHRKPDFSISRSEASSLDSIYQLFEEKKWDVALKALENPTVKEDWFYEAASLEAHILFLQNKYKKAAQVYQNVINKNESPFKEAAMYDQLLCYVAMYDESKEKANGLINKILENSKHPFFEQTAYLRKQLIAK